MANKLVSCQGCLLGLAVGDALGFTVDGQTLEEICADYGPNGLLGYDLANGCADVTSYTQLAAFVGNGLLLSVSRGKKEYLPYIILSLREWARNQQFHRDPEKSYCWVAKPKVLRLHNNRDARMLDALRAETLGTVDAPINRNAGPGVLAPAVALGMFYDPRRMDMDRLTELAVQTAALTHGGPEAILSAAVLSRCIADCLNEPEKSFPDIFTDAVQAMQDRYQETFPTHTELLAARIRQAVCLSQDTSLSVRGSMERLACNSAPSCLAGAMYACLTSHGDFDTAVITAVNHSGLSAAVGAVTGALKGARVGMDALPEFYLESLSPASVLSELASDLAQGSLTSGLFDDDWDHKYIQGLPLGEN